MKLIIALCLVSAVTAGSLLRKYDYSPHNPQIVRYENDNPGSGNYRYYYEQTDGTKQEQKGEIRNEGTEDEAIVVKGTFTWVGPDGVTYTVNYDADENGYQPEIEQGPGGGVPPAVVASLLG
ncbi:endocuticle structural protein SgAbd-6-like [Anticarsia gemmatalis]|uniref:endocuticle structural protein SgAbd-6-like n=1 Tax=Anticarsia gemmatalis TaxID=129554 RepID=UPI003F764B7C